ncbi:MAG: halocarboxylic acid dehydrogenase DehI family protein [Candidatus Methylomirabilia bacterium]
MVAKDPREYWQRAGKGAVQAKLVIIQEDEASEAVRECFDEITASLGFALVNVLFRAFAKYPRFLRLQWDFLRPNALTQDFFDKAEVIRRQALAIVREHFTVGDHRAELRMRGFADSTPKEIKAILDFFLYCDPFLLLMTSALQSSLAEKPLPGKPWAHLLPHYTHPTRVQEFQLVEIEASPPDVQTVYREVMKTLGLPFVPSDFRAVGRWPDYVVLAWEDWKNKPSSATFQREVRKLNELAVALALDLPFPLAIDSETLKHAGFNSAQIADILATVDFFQGLVPGLITSVAALKLGIEGGSQPVRRQ